MKDQLCYFLVDDGDIDKGMFLASAYEKFILWQNGFIDEIINKNNMSGILNSYISQLQQEIDIQEATLEDVININDNIYEELNEIINHSSIRNIYKNNKIDYRYYNDIIYNFDYIEEELGKRLLSGKHKFKNNIHFITYLYEGFRGENSSLLENYNNKYPKRELKDEEKESLIEFAQVGKNASDKFYNEVLSSLQILMNSIVKDNYDKNSLIYDAIEKLPKYVILEDNLLNLLKNNKLTIDSLVATFEYFEALCWKEIQKQILPDYKLNIIDEDKKYINEYFQKIENKNSINLLITRNNLTMALRRLISRYLAGTKQEIDINSDRQLFYEMQRGDLWNKEIIDNEGFEDELSVIINNNIIVGSAFDLYNALGGDLLLEMEIFKKKENEIHEEEIEENRNEIIENIIDEKKNEMNEKELFDDERSDDDSFD